MVVSLDGSGVLTRHFPIDGFEPLLKNEGLYTLPFSYELDDAPYYEKFYLITSETPLNIDSIESTIKTGGEILADQELVLLKGVTK